MDKNMAEWAAGTVRELRAFLASGELTPAERANLESMLAHARLLCMELGLDADDPGFLI